MVEHLVGYAKRDLLVPGPFADVVADNTAAVGWCAEVNAAKHSEICAVPNERLDAERPLLTPVPSLRPRLDRATFRKVDKLSCVRFGSARYSVPTRLIGAQVELLTGQGRSGSPSRSPASWLPSTPSSHQAKPASATPLRLESARPAPPRCPATDAG